MSAEPLKRDYQNNIEVYNETLTDSDDGDITSFIQLLTDHKSAAIAAGADEDKITVSLGTYYLPYSMDDEAYPIIRIFGHRKETEQETANRQREEERHLEQNRLHAIARAKEVLRNNGVDIP